MGYNFMIQEEWEWEKTAFSSTTSSSSLVSGKRVFDPTNTRTIMALIQISRREVLKLLPLV